MASSQMDPMDNIYREYERLRKENIRLKELLQKHGIDFEESQRTTVTEHKPRPQLSLEEKVTLFRNLFKGREDVFARRWYSQKTDKSGYQPVCQKEWSLEFCDKRKYKCSECPHREFQPLGYNDIYRHLEGKDINGRDVIGTYAILPDSTCWFLCCDFDDKSCEHGSQEDVKAYMTVCQEWQIPAYTERSRSGKGAHVWILFSEPVKAKTARQLGNTILTDAMERDGKLSFKSYDRFFPNQDFLPEGGFGNLVALPLQGQARKKGNSVFVDEDFLAYPDQWAYLRQMQKLSSAEVDALIAKHCQQEPLGELLKSNESSPWERPPARPIDRKELPSSIKIVRSSGLYIPTKTLPPKAVNHLKRLAAFKNPEFFRNLAMRLPTYHLPRIVSCADFVEDYLVMPRGCEDAVLDFFSENGVEVQLEDKTNPGKGINVEFIGSLRPEQAMAVDKLSQHSCGTLYAATAFGKTVTSIALIARKKVNTLILVHTKALLDQWREKLAEFLETDFKPNEEVPRRGRRKQIQQFGGLSSTENTLNGNIDIALLQSCMNDNEVKAFVRDYGMVIVDECHHAPAVNFEQVLKEVNARYIYGLTATPIRKDGHQPIIFMQCGEIRFTADSSSQTKTDSFRRLLIPRFTAFRSLRADGSNYAQVIDELVEDEARNQLILSDVAKVLSEGRSPIILTARTSHVDLLTEECRKICRNVIRLVGNDSAKTKRETLAQLSAVPNGEPLVVVATGKYVGEGFDLPRLDTLILALPVSWKGLITQYTGRLHRQFPGKKEVRIYDYVDLRVPICDSMYRKRLSGYKAVGYSIGVANEGLFAEQTTDTIFDAVNFRAPFLADLAKAKQSIVIAVKRLRWTPTTKTVELLEAAMHRGIKVTIVFSETNLKEKELRSMGIYLVQRQGSKLNCAIIDKHIGWYGSVNLLGHSIPDTNVIRMLSTDFATALHDTLAI